MMGSSYCETIMPDGTLNYRDCPRNQLHQTQRDTAGSKLIGTNAIGAARRPLGAFRPSGREIYGLIVNTRPYGPEINAA
jgi:hypothetical protein